MNPKYRISLILVSVVVAAAISVIVVTKAYDPTRWWLYSTRRNSLVPIEFVGRVVDRHGNPISGAEVVACVKTLNSAFLLGEPDVDREVVIRLTTSDDGRFRVYNVKGRTLRIESISKDGFVPNPRPGWQGRGDFDESWFYYYAPSYGPELVYVPDSGRPAIFPLLKPNEAVEASPSRGGKIR